MTMEELQPPGAPASNIGIPQRYRRRKHPASNFEMIAWLFMRISGVLLTILIVGHLVINMVLGDGVHQIDFAFVAGKWTTPFWQFWDLAMLWLAMLHGVNGLRTIINDYATKAFTRKIFKLALYLVTATIVVLGTLIIFTFDPCMINEQGELLDKVPQFCYSLTP